MVMQATKMKIDSTVMYCPVPSLSTRGENLNQQTTTKFITAVTRERWTRGWMAPTWGQAHQYLEYTNEPFNDPLQVTMWKEGGHDYKKYTGDMIDHKQGCPQWCDDIARQFPLHDIGTSLYRMEPGCHLPTHQDTYKAYIEYAKVDLESIFRVIVFLEDWKTGHYFEINETPIVNYKAGDWICWHADTPHMAVNLGYNYRYTLQITGWHDN